jgi:hypothetical protein
MKSTGDDRPVCIEEALLPDDLSRRTEVGAGGNIGCRDEGDVLRTGFSGVFGAEMTTESEDPREWLCRDNCVLRREDMELLRRGKRPCAELVRFAFREEFSLLDKCIKSTLGVMSTFCGSGGTGGTGEPRPDCGLTPSPSLLRLTLKCGRVAESCRATPPLRYLDLELSSDRTNELEMRARAKVVPDIADVSSFVIIDDGREVITDNAKFEDDRSRLCTFPEASVESDSVMGDFVSLFGICRGAGTCLRDVSPCSGD